MLISKWHGKLKALIRTHTRCYRYAFRDIYKRFAAKLKTLTTASCELFNCNTSHLHLLHFIVLLVLYIKIEVLSSSLQITLRRCHHTYRRLQARGILYTERWQLRANRNLYYTYSSQGVNCTVINLKQHLHRQKHP